MSLIPKHLIIYQGNNCSIDNRPKVLKYGLQLNSIQRCEHLSTKNEKLFVDIVHKQGRKRITKTEMIYQCGKNQDLLVKDLQCLSSLKKFTLNFNVEFDYGFYKSESDIDSQWTVKSDGQREAEDSENELDLEIKSSPSSSQRNKNHIERIFNQAKKVSHLSLYFIKMDSNHEQALRYLPMLNLLEECQMKIKILSPSDILALRDLLKATKKRNYFPNMKSMVIKLRHSYNKKDCSSKFILFCKTLKEISEIIQDLPWIKIQLKIKYMHRLDESAIISLQKALQKANNQYVKLSLVAGQPKNLKPLLNTIKDMNNLKKFSLRCNELSDLESAESMESLLESLGKIKSLQNLKLQGKNLLDKKELFSTENVLHSLGGLSQINSLHWKGENRFIDNALWGHFSNSISKLSQLQTLFINFHVTQALEIFPDSNGFIDFFTCLKNLTHLQIFNFDIFYDFDYSAKFKRIDGSQVFPAFCQALGNLKELQNLHFRCPWAPRPNSDVEELTKILPSLQKIQHFSFHFQANQSPASIENDVFLKFAKAICCLQSLKNFTITFEMKEISEMTYEIVLFLFKHFKQTKAHWRLVLRSKQIDEQVKKNLTKLTSQVYIWKS